MVDTRHAVCYHAIGTTACSECDGAGVGLHHRIARGRVIDRVMSITILIIQNDPHEGAGLLATLATERGLKMCVQLASELPAQQCSVDSAEFVGLILLGGPQVRQCDIAARPHLHTP